jgi:uncharacterized membrane protein (DUF2068 family)
MPPRRERLVVLIGTFKLVKAALLIAAGVVAIAGGAEELARGMERASFWLGGFPGRHTLRDAADKLWSLDGRDAGRLAVAAFAYAAVFVVEGIGLVMKKHWAEWLTVIVSGSFIPIEIYEMAAHFGPGKVVALILNVAIVIYLLWDRLRDRRPAQRPVPSPATPAAR